MTIYTIYYWSSNQSYISLNFTDVKLAKQVAQVIENNGYAVTLRNNNTNELLHDCQGYTK